MNSDISKLIQVHMLREMPGSREYEAELRVVAIGQIDTSLNLNSYNHAYERMMSRLNSIVLDTIHRGTIHRLEQLCTTYISVMQSGIAYEEYKVYCNIVDDLQKLIRELRGL